jgi:tetratricopeptide (TPR) repeat protein
MAIVRETGDRRGEGRTLGNIGMAYAELGETRRAIDFYEQVLQIARETGDRRGEGTALGSLGAAYADLGETRRAIDFYEQVLQIARETGDRRDEGTALWNMALALGQLEGAQAMVYAEAALAIYEQIESPHADMVRSMLAEWKAGDGADQR